MAKGNRYELLVPEFDPLGGVRIGVVALASDHRIESELGIILAGSSAVLNVTRIRSSVTFDWETLAGMTANLDDALSLLLPETKLDVLVYGCTSGTVAAGEEKILRLLQQARRSRAVTTPITAAKAALRSLGIHRIAILSPYAADVHAHVVGSFVEEGFGVVASASFGVTEDRRISQISRNSLLRAAERLATTKGIEGIFVSCTALHFAQLISPLERELGVPVVASNQALAWHSLRLAGNTKPVKGFGRLLNG